LPRSTAFVRANRGQTQLPQLVRWKLWKLCLTPFEFAAEAEQSGLSHVGVMRVLLEGLTRGTVLRCLCGEARQ
jgi:hypothetical protein